MKIKSVYVEMNKKISAQFQSFGNSVGLSADLEEGDDADAVVRELQRNAMGLLVKLEKKKAECDSNRQIPRKEEDQ
jgi:hypothetical protein